MKVRQLHRWDVTPREAREIQEQLRARVVLHDTPGEIRTVAGADAAVDAVSGRIFAGVVVFRYPGLEELERAWVCQALRFPYVPGLLSFREAPALLAGIEKLKHRVDVLFCDGQGYAHPRRFGLACHLGLLLDCATIGCAKTLLVGTHRVPGRNAGSFAELRDGEIIGAAVRTRPGVKPVYVSAGHRVSLERAIELTLAVCDGTRIPKPTREADGFVEAVKKGGRG